MTTYVIRNGSLVEKRFAAPPQSSGRPQRHISDTQDLLWHPATGKRTDSKSAFRRMTKDAGCIEVGDHKFKSRQPVKLDKRQRVEAIKRAIHELRG